MVSRAGCVVAAGLLLAAPVSAAAQAPTPNPDDLGSIILPGVFTGFRKAPAGSYNGPLDSQALSDLSDGEFSPADFKGISAYAKTWVNKHDDVVVAFLYRFTSIQAADQFFTEFAAGANQSGVRTATLRELPRAFSFIDTEGGISVVQHRGRYVSAIYITSDRNAYRIADAIELARQQAARFPIETPPAPAPTEAAEGAAAGIGSMVAAILPVFLFGAFLSVRGARRHRKERDRGRYPWSEAVAPPVPGEPREEPAAMRPFSPESGRGWRWSARKRSRVLVLFLAVAGVAALAAMVSAIMQADLLDGVRAGNRITFEAAKANDDREMTFNFVWIAALVATAIAWCVWQHRAQSNLARLGSQSMLMFSPGWAVGWWFVPFMNLVRPYQAMNELAESSTDPQDFERRISLGRLVGWWWGLWVGAAFLVVVTRTMDDGIDEVVMASWTNAAAGLLRAAAAVLAILIIVRIQRLQDHAAGAVVALGGSDTLPPLVPPPPPVPTVSAPPPPPEAG